MKWIGALIIIGVSALFGLDMSVRLSDRSKQLRLLIQSLQMIEAEMVYGKYTLKHIFIHVKQRTTEPFATFYDQLANRLSSIVDDFNMLWEQEVERLYDRSKLHRNEIDILKQLGKNLGIHPIDQQRKHLTLTQQYLKQQLDHALDQEKKYEKTTKSLSILVGVFIVLILM